jgi:hypothetical protein
MGQCKFCGKDAGFLRHKHEECESAHDAGVTKIRENAAEVFASGHGLDSLLPDIQSIASHAFITADEIRRLLTRMTGA